MAVVAPQPVTVTRAVDLATAGPFLARALSHDVAWPGDLEDTVRGCAVFELRRGPDVVGAFAAKVDRYKTGTALMVTAAGAAPGADVLGSMCDWIEQQARDVVRARQAQCLTARPGLVRALKARGYRIGGYFMTKDV